MIEYLEVSFHATEPKAARFKRWVQDLEARGYEVDVKFGVGTWHRFLAPIGDDSWTVVLKKASAAGLIDEDWCADWYEQVYSEEDVRTAPFFSLVHVGHDIDISTGRDKESGVCHFTDVDLSGLCPLCNSGGRQAGPLRLPGAELNRCGQFGSIALVSNDFYFLAERLAAAVVSECACELPLLEIDTYGKVRAKERWFQLLPEFVLPGEAVRPMRQGMVVECSRCHAARLQSTGEEPSGSYELVRRASVPETGLPPVVCWPCLEGELVQFPDGRVIGYPSRRLWLRGDVGRSLAAKGVPGLELRPIVLSEEGD